MTGRAKFLTAVLLICATATACNDVLQERVKPDVQLLASNAYVTIAGQSITLPWIALEEYAYTRQSFSLSRSDERSQESKKRAAFHTATSRLRTH